MYLTLSFVIIFLTFISDLFMLGKFNNKLSNLIIDAC